ncbi:major capsid protein [Ruegeria lacuscaerulensis]|uniref:major capsid protein n=1 Tax=Ruegeria lacuscaerulensis TaxID=55218 RepID=UPI00147D6A64|nr:hypothetical protein [Ruegeria lacuscaerulensis]
MADELITLPEYAKGLTDPLSRGMIQQFSETSDILSRIPFKTVQQGRNVFDRSTALPAMQFRGLNQEPEISHGETEEFQDHCAPLSGLLEVDRLKKKRYGERKMVQDMQGQMIKASELWTQTFFDGDTSSEPREYDGLKRRLTDQGTGSVDGTNKVSRLIANSVASGGGALSLTKLDIAIRRVARPNALIMSPLMQVKFTQAMRDTNLTGHVIHYEQDAGNRVLMYGKLPILTGYDVSETDDILPFDEVGQGGGAAQCTSIYVASFREDGVCGIQTAPFEVVPLGPTDRGIFHRNLAEWDSGITIEDKYSGLRLSSITDAAIVA